MTPGAFKQLKLGDQVVPMRGNIAGRTGVVIEIHWTRNRVKVIFGNNGPWRVYKSSTIRWPFREEFHHGVGSPEQQDDDSDKVSH